jgi:hypothetical protein
MSFKSASSGRSSSGTKGGPRVTRDPDSCYYEGGLEMYPNNEIRGVINSLRTTIPIVIKKIDKNGTKTYLMRESLGALNTIGNFSKSNNKVVSPILTACSLSKAQDKASYRYASDASTWSGQSRGYGINWDKSSEKTLKLSELLDYFKRDNNVLTNIQTIEDYVTNLNAIEDKSNIHVNGMVMMNGQIDEETNTPMPDGPAFFVVIEKKMGGRKTRKTRKPRKTRKMRKTRK